MSTSYYPYNWTIGLIIDFAVKVVIENCAKAKKGNAQSGDS